MKAASQILLVVALLGALSGGIFLLVNRTSNPTLEIVLPTPTSLPLLQVYVTGAVESPGVYTLTEGDRVAQAVEAAGGPVEEADLERVNLATRLRDEDHWHVPRVGEPLASSQEATAPAEVDINSANLEQLDSLPRIGPVLAQAIVSYREAHGPFSSVEDLLNVSGIGVATLEAIRSLVTAK